MIYRRTHVVTHIKLRTAGHICKVGISKAPRKILEGKIYGSRAVGKSKTGGYARWATDARELLGDER
jgi:hypothetical protein